MKKLDICLSTDDNYAKYASTVIKSIAENKDSNDDCVFHILYSKLSDANMKRLLNHDGVILHKIDNEIFAPYFNNGVCKNVTIPTLYRLKLPSLLPDVKRILYLDCDIVVLKSLAEVFATVLDSDMYAAAVPDMGWHLHMARMNFESAERNFYFNAGVCLLDLEKMRQDDIEEKMFEYLKNNWENLSYSDQDVMNAVLLGKVKELDKKYNFITPNFYFSNDKDATIVHFAGIKPWKIGFYNKYREIFWDYFMQTEFCNDKTQIACKNKICFMHARFLQALWYLKMYPLFFLKEGRRHDFMRIIKDIKY